MHSKYNLITILGPTASGKTSLAANIAYHLHGEIISADSRQVYKQMDIGTGKDLEDYTVNDQQIPYHLIDLFEPGYKFNVFEYQELFYQTYQDLTNKNTIPVLCGGTGMYIESVIEGYQMAKVPANPELRKDLELKETDKLIALLKSHATLHNTTDITSRKRLIRAIEIATYQKDHPTETARFPQLNTLLIGIKFDRESRRRRITERLNARLDSGMIEEVNSLLKQGIKPEDLIFYGLEYKFITLYLTNQMNYNDMVQKLNTAIHQFAKRQMTWFRRMERKGYIIHWLDGYMPLETKVECALQLYSKTP